MVFLSSEGNDTGQRKHFKTQCTKGSGKRERHKTAARRTAKRRAGRLFFISITQRKAVRGQRRGSSSYTSAMQRKADVWHAHSNIS